MSARREHACDRRCRWTTYGIKTEEILAFRRLHSESALRFRRFDANEINTQLFNFWDKLGPPDNTITLRSRDFATAIRHRATWEFAAFNTIQSLGFSFTNSPKRRTADVGLY